MANMAANMSAESDSLGFIYPDHSKVLCVGIMGLYKSKAWTDLALIVNGCETLVHTFMISLFAPKLISHCEDNRCDLQGFNVDQDTISTLLDFIYNGQVTVERHRLDSIRRGADLMGLNVLSQLISEETKQDSVDSLSIDEETKQDSIDSLSIETETNEQIIPSNNCEKPPKIYKDAILRCSRCDFKVEITDGFRELSIDEFKDHLAKVHHVNFDKDAVKISYKCWDCDFEDEDRKALKKHKRSRHSKKKVPTFKCCKCDFLADEKWTVVRHLRSEHPSEKSLKCPECDFRTMRQKALKAHQKVEHNTGEYECDECGRRFATPGGKKHHYRLIHLEPEDQIACYLCSFKTKVRAELKQHLADEHNIRRKRIHWPRVYNEKMQCPHCGAVLKTKTHLIDHLAGKHKVDLEGNPVEPKYNCKSCNFVAYSRRQLYRHNYRTHSKVEFRCDYCDFKCRCRTFLRDHVRWKHFGERTYMCEVCGQSFGTSNHLSSHRKFHSETSESKSKQFNSETSQSKLKKFQCEFCDKSFTHKHLLKQHIINMHDENARRHQCELCSYAAKTKWNLSQHVKSMHKEMTLQVVEEGEDIRESEIAVMEVENYELVVQQAQSA